MQMQMQRLQVQFPGAFDRALLRKVQCAYIVSAYVPVQEYSTFDGTYRRSWLLESRTGTDRPIGPSFFSSHVCTYPHHTYHLNSRLFFLKSSLHDSKKKVALPISW